MSKRAVSWACAAVASASAAQVARAIPFRDFRRGSVMVVSPLQAAVSWAVSVERRASAADPRDRPGKFSSAARDKDGGAVGTRARLDGEVGGDRADEAHRLARPEHAVDVEAR